MLLGVQTIGAAVLLMNGVPVYRQMVGELSQFKRHGGVLWWAITAVALIQLAYWLRVRLQPALPRSGHIVLGHIVFFIARLSFIFASSSFAVIFFSRFEQLSFPPHRILMVIALLFSLFCYALELERLARAFQGAEGKPAT